MKNQYYLTNFRYSTIQFIEKRNFGALNYYGIITGSKTKMKIGELSINLSEKLSRKLSRDVEQNPSFIKSLPKRCYMCERCSKLELGIVSSAVMKVNNSNKSSDCLTYSIINGYNVNHQLTEFIDICPVGCLTNTNYNLVVNRKKTIVSNKPT